MIEPIADDEGLSLVKDGDDYFVEFEDEPNICASLLFAHHEQALHDWNGQETDLTPSQIKTVDRWADQYL